MDTSSLTVDDSAPITVDAVTSSSSSSSSSSLELICSIAGWIIVDSVVGDVGISDETSIVSIVISVVVATAATAAFVALSSVAVGNSTESKGSSLTFSTSSTSCDIGPDTDSSSSSSSWDGVPVTVVDDSLSMLSFGCSCFVTTISTFFNDWWLFVLCCSVVVMKVAFGGIAVVANGVVETKADNDSDVITFFLTSFSFSSSSSSFSFDGDSCFLALVPVDDERCFLFVFFFFFSLCFFLMVELDMSWLLLPSFSVVAIPSSRWTMPVGVNCIDGIFKSSFSLSREGLVGDLTIFFLRFFFVLATFDLATCCCFWKCLIPPLLCRVFFFFIFFFLRPSCSSAR
mmetsp:Transcript_4194/g.10411  ORF Transcript_4194/g.10411 Transcript_4194/m.10411 type:complete len:343 (-) Transcript_4194:393-1421(-)